MCELSRAYVSHFQMPKSKVGRLIRSPFMKFLYYSVSFGCFLVLLTAATFEPYREKTGEVKGAGEVRASDRGPPPTVIEWDLSIRTPMSSSPKILTI